MSPDSITFYQLEIPPNTPLFRALRDNEVTAPANWDVKRARSGQRRLRRSSRTATRYVVPMPQCEIHFVSRFLYQEMQYRGADLVGTGLASFSYVAATHYQNVASLPRIQRASGSESLAVQPRLRTQPRGPGGTRVCSATETRQVSKPGYFSRKFGINIGEQFCRTAETTFPKRGGCPSKRIGHAHSPGSYCVSIACCRSSTCPNTRM